MNNNNELTAEQRFELRLHEVLREAANPNPSLSLEARIKLAMQGESQRRSTMHAVQAYPASSILWSGQRISSGWNARGFLGAAALHAALLALILVAVAHRATMSAPPHVEAVALVAPPPPPVLHAPPRPLLMGGGGGQKGPAPVTRGNPPRFAAVQLNPPKAPPLAQPKLAVPATVELQPDLRMARTDVPQIGMPNSPLVGLSMGNGSGTGLGSGTGAGIGPGVGGNTGGGVKRIGGGVSAPVVLYQPEPEFSDEARKAKIAGNVLVYLQVDEQGRPRHVRVLRGIGMGLDQKAVAAVEHYRFRPAMENGHPVSVEMQVDVGFQIY